MSQEPGRGGPPPRPAMVRSTPPPIHSGPTPPGAVRTSRTLWLTSFVVGLIALVLVFFSRDDQLEHIRTLVTDLGGDADTGDAAALPNLVLWGSITAVVLVIVLEAVLVRAMVQRQRWARLALAGALVAHAAAVVVADSFLTEPGEDGTLVRWLLLAQGGLAALAWLSSLLPGAHPWFHPATPGTHRRP